MNDRERDSTSESPPSRTRRALLAAAGAVGATVLAGCVGNDGSGESTETDTTAEDGMGGDGMDDGSTDGGMDDGMETTATGGENSMDSKGTDEGMGTETGMGSSMAGPEWIRHELSDVTSDETFTIGEFDVPVVLSSSAVWCPKCTSQQEKFKSLRDRLGDDVVVVSLNTDPNESEQKVQSHAESHDFDWRYAVAPAELTDTLIDEFGSVIATAPAVPIVVVCPDGSASLIDERGVKSVDTVVQHVNQC